MTTLSFTAIAIGATFDYRLVESGTTLSLFSDKHSKPNPDFVPQVVAALADPKLASFQLVFCTPGMAMVHITSQSGQAVEVSVVDAMNGYAETAQNAEVVITQGPRAIEFHVDVKGEWE